MARTLVLLIALLLVPAAAAAHPGHGHTDAASLWHALEPAHLALIAAPVLLGLGLWRLCRRSRR